MTLKDTAVLSGGYYETGSITFTLYLGSTLVDTETVSVNGNGTYTTPTGYTLPTTGTVTGTYQWDASYSGDTNNTSASENNVAAEQVVVEPREPDDHHDAEHDHGHAGHVAGDLERHGGSVGRLLRDGLDHLHPLPGQHAGGHGDGGGQRQRQYTTPTGYTLPTTGTVTGTYQWDASYTGDTNNTSASENNAAAEQVASAPRARRSPRRRA